MSRLAIVLLVAALAGLVACTASIAAPARPSRRRDVQLALTNQTFAIAPGQPWTATFSITGDLGSGATDDLDGRTVRRPAVAEHRGPVPTPRRAPPVVGPVTGAPERSAMPDARHRADGTMSASSRAPPSRRR